MVAIMEQEKLPLEELTSDGQASGLEAEVPSLASEIVAPFDPAKIDVITQARTVDLLLTRLQEGELNLSPDFQRRGNLWSDERKSSLIESLLLRIPIPSLYVSEDEEGNYTVVDGLQRMCAISHFVDVASLNKAVKSQLSPLRLCGLQSLPTEYNDQSYDDLPRPLKRRISETELTLHVIRASTPQAVKFNIFSRINRGGLPLSAQEIRNAIYPGRWRDVVRELAEGDEFRQATERRIRGERMEDIELVLRFAAHYSLQYGEERPDNQNLDEFLNDFVVEKSPKFDEEQWERLSLDFKRAMRGCQQVFGRYAFRKYYGRIYSRSPINRGLFETQAVVMSRFTDEQISVLSKKKDEILDGLAILFNEDNTFVSSLLYATGRGNSSNNRIEAIHDLLAGKLND